MAKTRPTSILIVAILHFVFGGLGLCGAGIRFSGVQEKLAELGKAGGGRQQISQEELKKHIEKREPNFATVEIAESLSSLLLSILMIASGIGLINMQPWGRTLSILYAALSILLKVFGAVYAFGIVLPATREFAQEIAARGGAEANLATALSWAATLTTVVVFLTIVYPLVVLIIMLRASTAAAFRGEAVAASPEEDSGDSEMDGNWER